VEIASPGRDGTVDVHGLPGGEYFVAAVDTGIDDRDHDSWTDPTYLEELVGDASRVMLTEGVTTSANLRLISR